VDILLQAQIEQCAPAMNAALMAALVRRESNGNPFAIGLDGKERFLPQPRSLGEAVAAAEKLARTGKTFSVGLAQIHISNIKSFSVTWPQAFNACASLRRGQQVFESFHARAIRAGFRSNDAVFAALRGYNSGSVFAPVSNAYASSIIADAAKPAVAQAWHDTLALNAALNAAAVVLPATRQGGQGESAELFDK
jgi:type IV secretion system protein VirB1